MTKYIIDPPSGWKYGFPKEAPYEVWDGDMTALTEWLKENGYPEKEMEYAKYSRYWIEEGN